MLEEAHKALEAMSAACTAMKVEEWGEAERSLHQVHRGASAARGRRKEPGGDDGSQPR